MLKILLSTFPTRQSFEIPVQADLHFLLLCYIHSVSVCIHKPMSESVNQEKVAGLIKRRSEILNFFI